VQNNGNVGNSLLINQYNAERVSSLHNNFNTSGHNPSTTASHLRLRDEFSKFHQSVWSPQTNTNISNVHLAFASPGQIDSNAWAAKVDRLDINTQNKSVSANKTGYFT
jgi:hypothetical protein